MGVGVGLQPTPAPGDRGEPPFTPDAKHSQWAAACSPFYVLCFLKLNFSSEDKAGSRANTARESLSEKLSGPLYGQENRWEEINGLHNVQQPVSGAGKHSRQAPCPWRRPLLSPPVPWSLPHAQHSRGPALLQKRRGAVEWSPCCWPFRQTHPENPLPWAPWLRTWIST